MWLISTLSAVSQPPQCTALRNPANGSINVAVTETLQWAAVANATRYYIDLGTSPGAKGVLDNFDAGSVERYTHPGGLLPNTTYYITIRPANNSGAATVCPEESFTTGELSGLAGCVTPLEPVKDATGVNPTTEISWFPQSGAEGYIISIGTIGGGNEILAPTDVGPDTSVSLPDPLPLSTRIFVNIVPYNGSGQTVGCSDYTFRTRNDFAPGCTEILDPIDGARFVSVTSNITWIRDFNAAGYIMTIEEKSRGGVRIMDRVDVGNGTNFKPPNFMGNTLYFVTIMPYNDLGIASCEPISFTTGDAPPPPACPDLLMPLPGSSDVSVDSELEWETVNGADGFLIRIGTTPGSDDLMAETDLGFTTEFIPQLPFPDGEEVYLQISPYNSWGQGGPCPIYSFVIEGMEPSAPQGLVPPFFTPNNDGFNDLWTIHSLPGRTVRNVFIFNRYGQLIRQLGDKQVWDGNHNGRQLSSGSYWYRIETAEGDIFSGFLLLKR